jgi:hypothetical protein
MTKIIIAGGRNLGNYKGLSPEEQEIKVIFYRAVINALTAVISANYGRGEKISIISGRCGKKDAFSRDRLNFSNGGDGMGERASILLGCPVESFPANWDKHGKPAGMIRNGEMAQAAYKSGNGVLIALPGGNGTANMVTQARKVGLKIIDLRNLI